jgi:hypothetical protein
MGHLFLPSLETSYILKASDSWSFNLYWISGDKLKVEWEGEYFQYKYEMFIKFSLKVWKGESILNIYAYNKERY